MRRLSHLTCGCQKLTHVSFLSKEIEGILNLNCDEKFATYELVRAIPRRPLDRLT